MRRDNVGRANVEQLRDCKVCHYADILEREFDSLEWREPMMPGGSSSNSTSRSLLSGVHRDDPEAWERMVRLYAPLVVYWCRRANLREQDIADVFQEVFQSVARNISGFRKVSERDTFRGWLRTVTRSRIGDFYRKGQHDHAAGGTDAQLRMTQVPADDAEEIRVFDEATEWGALYRRALEIIRTEFEDRTWRAFWRTTVDGQRPRDVADEFGMSPGAVRVAKSRVLKRLREELGDL